MWDKLNPFGAKAGESINAPNALAEANPEKISEGALDEPVFTTVGFGYVQGAPVFVKMETQGSKVVAKSVEKINNLYIAQTNFKTICVKLFPKIFQAGPY